MPFCVVLVSLNCTNFVCDANEVVCLLPTAPTPVRPPPQVVLPSFRPGQPVRISLSQILTKAVLISLRVALSPFVPVPFIPSHSPYAFLSCLSSVCFASHMLQQS